jgi:hypothetical protein
MPDQLGHYRALIATNARLAGAHRAGRLPGTIDANFPFDPALAQAADPIRHDAQQLRNRIARYAEFCTRFPQVLPANIRAPAFHARLMDEVPRFLEHEYTIKRWLYSQPDMIVFCHWNANVDNAWFWRDEVGNLHCGLIDWGRVGQMNAASALWGSLSGAEKFIWDDHLGELLGLFVDEFHGAGGPLLDPRALQRNLEMLVALLGICWLLDAVPIILREIPQLEALQDRTDSALLARELARTQLHMLTIFMNMWDRLDVGKSLDALLAGLGGGMQTPADNR